MTTHVISSCPCLRLIPTLMSLLSAHVQRLADGDTVTLCSAIASHPEQLVSELLVGVYGTNAHCLCDLG